MLVKQEAHVKDRPNRFTFIGNLEHRGGMKLSHHGVEFSRKARNLSATGIRGRKG